MASWQTLYQGLRDQIVPALNGIVLPENVTIGYPATSVAQTAGQPDQSMINRGLLAQSSPLVMIYDRSMAKDVTRWLPHRITPWAEGVSTLAYYLYNNYVPSGGEIDLDITEPASINDALGVRFTNGTLTEGVVYGTSVPQTQAQVASGVATEINALPGYVATVSGATVTIQNNNVWAVTVQAAVGNVATSQYEVHRIKRSAQVLVMANRPTTLDLVGEPLSQLFGQLEVSYGFTLADTTWVRLINTGDIALWDNVNHNVARRDFMISLEYSVSILDTGYSVLAPLLTWTIDE